MRWQIVFIAALATGLAYPLEGFAQERLLSCIQSKRCAAPKSVKILAPVRAPKGISPTWTCCDTDPWGGQHSPCIQGTYVNANGENPCEIICQGPPLSGFIRRTMICY